LSSSVALVLVGAAPALVRSWSLTDLPCSFMQAETALALVRTAPTLVCAAFIGAAPTLVHSYLCSFHLYSH
jgi:hypothetical protein